MEEIAVVKALAALAQPVRLRVFRALVVVGPQGLTPSDLCLQLAVSPTSLSFHLKELMNADLVSQERDGRRLIYRAEFERMQGLLGFLTEHCCQGQPCAPTAHPSPPPPLSFSQNRKAHPMSQEPINVLFLCTGNSARSILAEGILQALAGHRFKAYSAGSHPKGEVHPMALEVLQGLNMSKDGYRSKSWDEFASPDAPVMNFVFTVCDNAAGEVCPVWPGQPVTAHWGVHDPAAVEGSIDKQRHAFQEVAHILKRRIELMLALPPQSLQSLSIQSQLNAIGKS
jgi:protein-tyrosine-phosphatase/DNA-binding transcriptional ArsR family regulator